MAGVPGVEMLVMGHTQGQQVARRGDQNLLQGGGHAGQVPGAGPLQGAQMAILPRRERHARGQIFHLLGGFAGARRHRAGREQQEEIALGGDRHRHFAIGRQNILQAVTDIARHAQVAADHMRVFIDRFLARRGIGQPRAILKNRHRRFLPSIRPGSARQVSAAAGSAGPWPVYQRPSNFPKAPADPPTAPCSARRSGRCRDRDGFP